MVVTCAVAAGQWIEVVVKDNQPHPITWIIYCIVAIALRRLSITYHLGPWSLRSGKNQYMVPLRSGGNGAHRFAVAHCHTTLF